MGGSVKGSNPAAASADILCSRLGKPDLGLILGSGFAPLADVIGATSPVPAAQLPGWPDGSVPGHANAVAVAEVGGSRLWIVLGRTHLYEGFDARQVAFPVEVLAAAGAKGVLLTTAAGGLLGSDHPGDLAVIRDHINLTGADPVRLYPPDRRDPAFPDLQEAYDPRWAGILADAATRGGNRVREGVLASVHGPCYETPAEVRMMRSMGADLASMSVVPETIIARYLGMRVSALACIANRGAGLDGAGMISHTGVLQTVERAVRAQSSWIIEGISVFLA